MASMTISPAAAAESAGKMHERGIATTLGVIAHLTLAAAALSLTIAAALSLIIWVAEGLTISDGGPATAVGLAVAGIASGSVFLKLKN
jgi:hypothetical protein